MGDALLETILGKIQFRLINETQPGSRFDPRTRSKYDSACHEEAFVALDVANVQIWDRNSPLLTLDFLRIPRLSTLAIGYIINQLVSRMPEGHSYVNVGLYYGYSLIAGILGNPNQTCIGVDNFSDPAATRPLFERIYEMYKGQHSRFHAQDYREYFSRSHSGPIGVYYYDGDHSYEHQLNGLEVARPYLRVGSYILVDDTNLLEARRATYDFVNRHPGEYAVIFDQQTPNNGHPTYWNGFLILKKVA